MCGIFGFVAAGDPADLARRLDGMRAALAHRGPDGHGSLMLAAGDGRSLGLGHVRLAIVAPDAPAAAQPIADPAGRYAMSFNGEIYNYPELIAELSARGHRFAAASDSAALLAAYAEWGADCLPRLRGMFAVAIWDRHLRRLFLARDAVGKKPLWLRRHGTGLAFASEIHALTAPFGAALAIDPAALADYLLYKYVPDNRCLIGGITELPAGSHATIDGADAAPAIAPAIWYRPPPRRRPERRRLAPADITGFLEALDAAVAIRLRADVPVGVFLSGGLDSSAVLALAARRTGRPLETFCVDFRDGEEGYSEAWAARRVAERFGARHHVLDLDAARFSAAIEDATWHRGAPPGEIADVALLELSRMARPVVKTVLSGEGADELLAGYPRYWGEILARRWQALAPAALDAPLARLARALPYPARRLAILARAAAERDFAARQAGWFGGFAAADLALLAPGLEGPGARGWRPGPAGRGRAGRDAALHAAMAFDRAVWLPGNILARGDRMTMAAGLEMRMPFMDTALAAHVAGLPDGAFLRGRTGKVVLRRAMAGILPDAIAARPKHGFRVPFHEWCRGPLRGFVEDRLLNPAAASRAFLRPAAVERLVGEHMRRERNHEKALWTLLGLEIHLHHLSRPPAAERPAAAI